MTLMYHLKYGLQTLHGVRSHEHAERPGSTTGFMSNP